MAASFLAKNPAAVPIATAGGIYLDPATGAVWCSIAGFSPGVVIPVTPPLVASLTSDADAAASVTPGAIAALAAGPNGIIVWNNIGSANNLRVASGTVSAAQGRQIPPGTGILFAVQNAADLNVCTETGAATYNASQA